MRQTRRQKHEDIPSITFEITVDNRDQFGKQHRTAIKQMVATFDGATTTYRSVKNKHNTDNDEFVITMTAPRSVDVIVPPLQRGHTLADHPPAWARPLGPPPPTTSPNRRAAWATTCALVELWQTRHAITTAPGLGPRPDDPGLADAWDAMTARIRALIGGGHLMHTPLPPGAPASDILAAVLTHLDSPPFGGAHALPAHPAVRDPHGIAPLNHATTDARVGRRGLAAALAGQSAPEAWIDAITAPEEDNEDECRAYTRLVTALADYRRRHHRAGADILGPRPDSIDGQGWDHLSDAIDLYTRARIEARLEQLRQRTEAARADLTPAPRVPPPAQRRDNRHGHRTGRPRRRRR
ncbi:hypothetical protein ACIP98_38315 [Streptomyces sp. NPDC088354]|uniref:hypothetical protein n=1 Tax=Streptomyces sp. NPDC088354 TaxID=3365856 RepID=UPI0038089D4A